MNQTNLPYEKTTRLKAETIIAALGKENSILCQISLAFHVDYLELTNIQALVEIFSTMPPPGVTIWQK